ncbi:MBL fold metallo-hydrolase [Patescibacteria group bacterium]
MSLLVKRLPVGQLETNCFLAWDEETSKGVVIDPGDDADFIIQAILDERVSIEAIIATHGHFDHVLAVNELKMSFDAPFVMHSKDEFLLNRMRETTQHFAGFDPGPAPKVDEYFDDVKKFGFGNVRLEIIPTPGHTPGSVALHSEEDSVLFVGDVLFAGGGVGRTDFSYCSSSELRKSINKLFQLPDQTITYNGHGREFYLADEKLYHSRV